MTQKSELRQIMRNKRSVLAENEMQQASLGVLTQLMPLLQDISSVAIYHAYNGELDLLAVIEYLLSCNKLVYQPVAYRQSRILAFEAYKREKQPLFYSSDYQLSTAINPIELDLVLVPLLAIDKRGYRLGQGGGYYDSTFAIKPKGHSPILCGVGYNWQLISKVVNESWDLKLDSFASEQYLYNF